MISPFAIVTGIAVIAAVIAVYKHGSVAAALVSAQKEATTIKADIKAAVTKGEATLATIKADLAKYL